MKKTIIALSITALATLAFAQEHRKVMIHEMAHDSSAIAAELGLSADQKIQFDAIHHQIEAAAQPLAEQMGAAEAQLHTLADAANPDATAVGRQFLALHDLQKQMKAIHESAKQKIDAILTPDQKAKFDSMAEHMEHMEHGPMMMRHPEPGSRN
jgi:Spy/CpxP family protein refolding chaperone